MNSRAAHRAAHRAARFGLIVSLVVGLNAVWTLVSVLVGGATAGAQIDPDSVIIPSPEPPEERDIDGDIRRLLRPERSIIKRREELDRRIIAGAKRLETLGVDAQVIAQDLTESEAAFLTLTSQLEGARSRAKTRLRIMGEIAAEVPLDRFLASDGFAAYQVERALKRRLSAADSATIAAYRELLGRWRDAQADLTRRRENLAHIRLKVDYQSRRLGDDRVERDRMIQVVNEQAEYYAAWRREMAAMEAELTERITALISVETPGRPRLYIQETKGRLGWPVRNPDVRSGYGIRRHRRFGARWVQRGVQVVPVRATDRAEVRAMYWGYVAFTGWVVGLGQVVILDHSKGYSSLYAHLESIEVEVGAKVRTGQALGLLGDTGSFSGKHLYFELRDEGRAVNPKSWLR